IARRSRTGVNSPQPACPGNELARQWDEVIDRHLTRQAVERGLSRNSLDAYGADLRDLQSFCCARQLAPAALDGVALSAWLEHLAQRSLSIATQRRRLAA